MSSEKDRAELSMRSRPDAKRLGRSCGRGAKYVDEARGLSRTGKSHERRPSAASCRRGSRSPTCSRVFPPGSITAEGAGDGDHRGARGRGGACTAARRAPSTPSGHFPASVAIRTATLGGAPAVRARELVFLVGRGVVAEPDHGRVGDETLASRGPSHYSPLMLWQPRPRFVHRATPDELAEASRRRELGGRLVILGHHYQTDEVRIRTPTSPATRSNSRNFVRAQLSARWGAKFVVFCGVHFMAERPADLPPRPDDVSVNLATDSAGCSVTMADMADYD